MKNDLLTQMIYRIVFCVISALACALSFGFFTNIHGTEGFTISTTFFRYYTNLSNYVCFIVGVAVCADTVKKVRRGERYRHNTCMPRFKFYATVMILVTFLVYVTLLSNPLTPIFWNSLGNLCYHVSVPILFILDWALFDEHKSIRILDPLRAFIIPIIYVIYIFTYGAIYDAVTGDPFPYFFLDVHALGYGGAIIWILILLAVFAVLGYLMFLYDKLVKTENGYQFDFTNLKL